MLIQRRLKCSGQWLVKHIEEKPHLQYFTGMEEYGLYPFGAPTPAAFRKQFSGENLAAILEGSVPPNESEDLWRTVARYRERHGGYPERILADKIYRSRQALAFYKGHRVRLSGSAPGTPSRSPALSHQARKLEYQDSCDHHVVEGVLDITPHSLSRVTAHPQEIGVALPLLKLSKTLMAVLALFCLLPVLAVFPELRSIPYLQTMLEARSHPHPRLSHGGFGVFPYYAWRTDLQDDTADPDFRCSHG